MLTSSVRFFRLPFSLHVLSFQRRRGSYRHCLGPHPSMEKRDIETGRLFGSDESITSLWGKGVVGRLTSARRRRNERGGAGIKTGGGGQKTMPRENEVFLLSLEDGRKEESSFGGPRGGRWREKSSIVSAFRYALLNKGEFSIFCFSFGIFFLHIIPRYMVVWYFQRYYLGYLESDLLSKFCTGLGID